MTPKMDDGDQTNDQELKLKSGKASRLLAKNRNILKNNILNTLDKQPGLIGSLEVQQEIKRRVQIDIASLLNDESKRG